VLANTVTAEESEDQEEECIFDQHEQEEAYRALEQKYPGSRYVEGEYHLLIPLDGDQVILRRGGCVHFGIAIEFRTNRTDEYDDESDFFARVSDLIADYGQDLLTPEMLEESRSGRAPVVEAFADGIYYLLPYPDATFEAFCRHDPDHTTLGVSFYY
jgi:hypothetical protein